MCGLRFILRFILYKRDSGFGTSRDLFKEIWSFRVYIIRGLVFIGHIGSIGFGAVWVLGGIGFRV